MFGTTSQSNQDKQENQLQSKIVLGSSSNSKSFIGIVTWNVNHLGEIKLDKNLADYLSCIPTKGIFNKENTGIDLIDTLDKWLKILKSSDVEDYKKIQETFCTFLDKVINKWKIFKGAEKIRYGEIIKYHGGDVKDEIDEDDIDEDDSDMHEEDRDKARKAVKNDLKKIQTINQINTLFGKNDWLQVMILQEVNEWGRPELSRKLSKDLKVYSGPMMKSYTTEVKGKGQKEYYPIIIKQNMGVEYLGYYYYNYNESKYSEFIAHDSENSGGLVNWSKRENTFRPLILYVLKIDGQKVYVGNLHTTPGGREFERQLVYDQIKGALLQAKEKADEENKAPLIIGGDYYLFRESRVLSPKFLLYFGNKNFRENLDKIVDEKLFEIKYESFEREYLSFLFIQKILGNIKSKKEDIIKLLQTEKSILETVFENTKWDKISISKPGWNEFDIDDFTINVLVNCYNSLLSKECSLYLASFVNKDNADEAIQKTWKQKIEDFIEIYSQYLDSIGEKEIVIDKNIVKYFAFIVYIDKKSPRTPTKTRLVDKDNFDYERNRLELTFAHEMKNKFSIAQPVYGSNRHKPVVRKKPTKKPGKDKNLHSISRIADFFLHANITLCGRQRPLLDSISDMAQTGYVGHMHPSGGMLLADDDNLSCSQYWRIISDHFPIGAAFTNNGTEPVKILYNLDKDITKAIAELNRICAFWLLAKKIVEVYNTKQVDIEGGKLCKHIQEKATLLLKYFQAVLSLVKIKTYNGLEFGLKLNLENEIKQLKAEINLKNYIESPKDKMSEDEEDIVISKPKLPSVIPKEIIDKVLVDVLFKIINQSCDDKIADEIVALLEEANGKETKANEIVKKIVFKIDIQEEEIITSLNKYILVKEPKEKRKRKEKKLVISAPKKREKSSTKRKEIDEGEEGEDDKKTLQPDNKKKKVVLSDNEKEDVDVEERVVKKPPYTRRRRIIKRWRNNSGNEEQDKNHL